MLKIEIISDLIQNHASYPHLCKQYLLNDKQNVVMPGIILFIQSTVCYSVCTDLPVTLLRQLF